LAAGIWPAITLSNYGVLELEYSPRLFGYRLRYLGIERLARVLTLQHNKDLTGLVVRGLLCTRNLLTARLRQANAKKLKARVFNEVLYVLSTAIMYQTNPLQLASLSATLQTRV
jgi:hypothetical protein